MAYKNPREWAGARPWRVEDDLVMAASKNVYRIETTIDLSCIENVEVPVI